MDDESLITAGHDPEFPGNGQRPEEVEFGSVEDMRDVSARAGWDIEYRQIRPGELHASTTMVEFSDVSLQHEIVDRRIEIQGSSPSESVSLLVPSESSSFWVNGHTADGTHVAVVQPGEGLQTFTDEDVSVFTVHVPVALLKKLGHSETLLPKSVCQGSIQLLRLGDAAARALRMHTLSTMYDSPANRWSREKTGEYVARICNIITNATQEEALVRDENPKGALRTISRAREFIESSLDSPIAMGDVCNYSGCSMSKLERVFRRELGITPGRYILARRLAIVNRELKQADREHTMVSMVAMNYGFRHLGRFAAAYRQQFGELPSETLTAG